jgi:sulfide:quinone oxidoreductase
MADSSASAFRVLIAGGGVAAVELAAGLTQAARDRIHLTLLAPEEGFLYRPWRAGAPPGPHEGAPVSLTRIAGALGANLISDRLQWIDRAGGGAHTRTGRQLAFDALAVCVGAQARPRYPHAISLTGRRDQALTDFLQGVADGACARVAFVIPERVAWPLPLYELAMTVATMGETEDLDLELTFITPESEPLGVFGEQAGETVRTLLTERRIELIASSRCEVPTPERVVLIPDRRQGEARDRPDRRRELAVDAVVALPQLFGPHLRGLPCAPYGFIPIDRFCRVRGVPGVYAAGDATDFAIKHGGIASQQADVAAVAIAARAGAAVRPRPFHPKLEGILATGGEPAYLSAWLAGGRPFGSDVSRAVGLTSGPKVIAEHLAPWLEQAGE